MGEDSGVRVTDMLRESLSSKIPGLKKEDIILAYPPLYDKYSRDSMLARDRIDSFKLTEEESWWAKSPMIGVYVVKNGEFQLLGRIDDDKFDMYRGNGPDWKVIVWPKHRDAKEIMDGFATHCAERYNDLTVPLTSIPPDRREYEVEKTARNFVEELQSRLVSKIPELKIGQALITRANNDGSYGFCKVYAVKNDRFVKLGEIQISDGLLKKEETEPVFQEAIDGFLTACAEQYSNPSEDIPTLGHSGIVEKSGTRHR